MSSDVTVGLTPDIYGQVHPEETDSMIADKLQAFENEVEKLPEDAKKSILLAQEKCPDQLTKEFKLKFLRSEVFNADLAAKRYALYWDKRIEVCGPEKAFLPFTLNGALKDDAVALSIGFVNYLDGFTDPQGRAIIYIVPAKQDRTKYARESMVRAVWYQVHAAIESLDAQKHGVIFIAHPHGAKLSQFDRGLVKQMLPSIQGVIPVRLSAFHICQPPSFIKIILPFAKLFMSERMKKRLRLHFGSTENVRTKLEEFGMTKENIPTTLGGDAEIDMVAWLETRRAKGK